MALNFRNSIDPRLHALSPSQNDMVYEIPQGSAYTNKVIQKANNVTNNSISFNFNTPNKNTLIDRRFYCRVRFQCVFRVENSDTQNDLRPFGVGTFCPRAFPLAAVTQNLNVSINGTSISSNYSDIMYAYLHYASPDELLAYDLSQTPSQLDFFVNYLFYTPARSEREPFAPLFNNSSKQLPRSAFNMISYSTPNIPKATVVAGEVVPSYGNCVFTFEVVEPLMISPLLYASSKLESGLINVDNIGININLGNLNRAISTRSTITFAPTTTIIGTPELLLEFKNINTVDEVKIPKIVKYKYEDTSIYITPSPIIIDIATFDTFNKGTISSKTIELSVCPKKIYVYVARKKHDFDDPSVPFYTDSFLPITSLSLSYLNISGQFSTYSQNDLYNMSRKNGYSGSYQEFSGLAMTYDEQECFVEGLNGRIGLLGAPICINSTDLSLPSNIASGTLVSSQLQLTVNVFNQDDAYEAENAELVVIVVNDSIMEISENKMTTRIGYINQQDVLAVRRDGEFTSQPFNSQLTG